MYKCKIFFKTKIAASKKKLRGQNIVMDEIN